MWQADLVTCSKMFQKIDVRSSAKLRQLPYLIAHGTRNKITNTTVSWQHSPVDSHNLPSFMNFIVWQD